MYGVTTFCLYGASAMCMAMVFIVSFMNSTDKGREPKSRLCDLATGTLAFCIFIIIIRVWGKVN